MALPALAAIAAGGSELGGLAARFFDWGLGLGGVPRDAPIRKWASSLAELSGIAALAEAIAPDQWTGEKMPAVAIPAATFGTVSSLGIGLAPRAAARVLGKTTRAAKLGRAVLRNPTTRTIAHIGKDVGQSSYSKAGRVTQWLQHAAGFLPAPAAQPPAAQPPDDQAAAPPPVFSSPLQAALTESLNQYGAMYRHYLDSLNQRSLAQQKALADVLPQYQQALQDAGLSADAYLQAYLDRAAFFKQLLNDLHRSYLPAPPAQ